MTRAILALGALALAAPAMAQDTAFTFTTTGGPFTFTTTGPFTFTTTGGFTFVEGDADADVDTASDTDSGGKGGGAACNATGAVGGWAALALGAGLLAARRRRQA